MDIAIIGGGAAGHFAAIHLKEARPDVRVVLVEATSRVLAKVSLSGGGRCNVTNTFAAVGDLSHVYPRGHRLLRRLLSEFTPQQAYAWFERRGVALTVQDDECVFPRSQDSASIVGCLRSAAAAAGVEVWLRSPVSRVEREADGRLTLRFRDDVRPAATFSAVLLASGGAPRAQGHDWLAALGHRLEAPCPALFSFTVPCPELTALRGIVVDGVQTAVAGTKLRAEGPLLITHWGLSGPAVLRLSSYAARHLRDAGYKFTLLVSWTGTTDAGAAATVECEAAASPRRQLGSLRPFGLQARLWHYLLQRAGLAPDKPCAELGGKSLRRLAAVLTADAYRVDGRAAFREEFVTCGGVSLSDVDPRTMQSRRVPGLYFAGEVLDVDGVTGGFNFQAAWSSAWVAARAMAALAPVAG